MSLNSLSLFLLVSIGLSACKSDGSTDTPADGGTTSDLGTVGDASNASHDAASTPLDAATPDGSTATLTRATFCQQFGLASAAITYECCTDADALATTTRASYASSEESNCLAVLSGNAFDDDRATIDFSRAQIVLDELNALSETCTTTKFDYPSNRVREVIVGHIADGEPCSPEQGGEDISPMYACASGLACVEDAGENFCTATASHGEDCDEYASTGVPCDGELDYCNSTTLVCESKLANGSSCEYSSWCQSNYCDYETNTCASAPSSEYCPAYG